MSLTVAEIAKQLGLEYHGDGSVRLTRVASLSIPRPDSLSFLNNAKFVSQLQKNSSAAVILSEEFIADAPGIPVIVSSNPYLSYAQAAQLLYPQARKPAFTHPSAVVGENAEIGEAVYIGANAVLGDHVKLAQGVQIGAGSYIGDGVAIEEATIIAPNVSIMNGVKIGKRTRIHSTAVIGADGFGFANDEGSWVKIPQVGAVIIGDDVEIGAGTTIDRGAIDDTEIGDGVILDNQIQIGHNVKVGAHTAMAAGCAIAGSAVIGAYCNFAGMVGIAGHLEIADGTTLTGKSMVTHSLKKGIYASGLAVQDAGEWRKNAVRLRRLDALFKRVKKLEDKNA